MGTLVPAASSTARYPGSLRLGGLLHTRSIRIRAGARRSLRAVHPCRRFLLHYDAPDYPHPSERQTKLPCCPPSGAGGPFLRGRHKSGTGVRPVSLGPERAGAPPGGDPGILAEAGERDKRTRDDRRVYISQMRENSGRKDAVCPPTWTLPRRGGIHPTVRILSWLPLSDRRGAEASVLGPAHLRRRTLLVRDSRLRA